MNHTTIAARVAHRAAIIALAVVMGLAALEMLAPQPADARTSAVPAYKQVGAGADLPSIRVFAGEDGVTEAQLAEVRQRMNSILREFAARWGAAATPPTQVQVHITEAAQRAAWGYVHLHSCSQPYRDAQGNSTIAYRFGCSGPSHFVLAHEYAHVAQTHSGGRLAYLPHTPLWMLEGMAEQVESIYESQNGGRTYQALQSGNWWAARQARYRYALDDPKLCGCPPHYAAYTMGFVAVERLAQLAGEQAIFDFWPNLRRAEQNGQGFAEAFSETFGVTLTAFYASFDAYLNGERPTISVAPTGSLDGAAPGRIVARRLADGRTEFAWQVEDGERVLPRSRYFPTNAAAGRWLNSSDIVVDDVTVGRINARLRGDGRIEFAFTPTGGERILPPSRRFPADANVGSWLRSTLIEPDG